MPARTFVLALVWWSLAGESSTGWWIGAPLVLLAAWLARPRTATSLRLRGALRFAAYFVRGSVAGGIDVARRVFQPSLPIAPVFVQYTLRYPEGHPARLLFVAAVSLLPGTLAASVDGACVTLHALDPQLATPEALAQLEEHAGGVFGSSAADR
jgi:multicomponent Na+:H+ antiporter subunit E